MSASRLWFRRILLIGWLPFMFVLVLVSCIEHRNIRNEFKEAWKDVVRIWGGGPTLW